MTLVAAEDSIAAWVSELDLIDHHCHAVTGQDLDAATFEALLGESTLPAPAGCSAWDTGLGLAMRAWCAPLLELPAGAEPAAYLHRRREVGSDEVNSRMLAGGAAELLVDTGFRSHDLVPPERMGQWARGPIHEIVRLERLAEGVAAELGADGAGRGDRYIDAFDRAVAAQGGAVGWKTVAAYRGGLDLDWRRPSPSDVRTAAAGWLSAGPIPEPDGPRWRLEHPVLIRHGVWQAIDTGRPVQFHTGFGDTDARLAGSDPLLLGDLIAATADLGTPLMLLHCWPRHREAGYLAQVWPHVYLDDGEAIPQVGHRGSSVLAETLELAPWHKLLYSSDAFGLAELHHLGAVIHRRALAAALAPLAGMGFDDVELRRLAVLVSRGNAARVYPGVGLP